MGTTFWQTVVFWSLQKVVVFEVWSLSRKISKKVRNSLLRGAGPVAQAPERWLCRNSGAVSAGECQPIRVESLFIQSVFMAWMCRKKSLPCESVASPLCLTLRVKVLDLASFSSSSSSTCPSLGSAYLFLLFLTFSYLFLPFPTFSPPALPIHLPFLLYLRYLLYHTYHSEK